MLGVLILFMLLGFVAVLLNGSPTSVIVLVAFAWIAYTIIKGK